MRTGRENERGENENLVKWEIEDWLQKERGKRDGKE